MTGLSRFHFNKIKKYFEKDYSYEVLIAKLSKKYQMQISPRTLSRILKDHNLKRKNINESSIEELVLAIILELDGSGYNLGYKALWKRLRKVYGLKVRQKTVMKLLQVIDPDGVEGRSRYRLKRRMYSVPGPNYMWHSDGHDKLKRFGFPIYGFIDGFSRKVLSLNVCTSNNDPYIIAYFYLKLIEKHRFLPTIMRTDHGSEVIIMEDLHVALRYNHDDENAAEKSFVKGKSTHNQRIESYWRQFRQHMGDFYIHLFKKMEQKNLINISNPIHIQTLQYCFGPLIKEDIEITRKEWNEHRIRKQITRNFIGGIPNEMYDNPEKFGASDHRKPLMQNKMEFLFNKYTKTPTIFTENIEELVNLIIINPQTLSTAEEAFVLYMNIIQFIEQEIS